MSSIDWFIQQVSERGLEAQITEVDVIKVDKEKYMDNDITSFSAQQLRAKILSNDPSPTCYDKDGQIKPWAREMLRTYQKSVQQSQTQQE